MPTQATASSATRRDERELRDAHFAMRLSLIVGLAMLIGKTTVYFLTHSAAIFSDAAESVVHVIAVAFASFSLRLSTKSASPQFLYGYERITFFSAGFEGAMIVVAAIAILYESIRKWIAGLQLEHLGAGALLVLMAGLLNAGLGYYLLRTGRRTNSLILEADGKHVLTDSWTSFGVVGGLGLVLLTHWKPFDPLVAIAVAVNILWSGGHLVWRSAVGLMDYSDPKAGRRNSGQVGCNLRGTGHSIPWRTFPNHRIPPDHRSALVVPAPDIGQRGPPPRNHSGRTPAGRTGDARRSHDSPGVLGRPCRCPPRTTLHRET